MSDTSSALTYILTQITRVSV